MTHLAIVAGFGAFTMIAQAQNTFPAVGNVGIGTVSPAAPLQFSNSIQNRKIVLWDGTNNDHQYYGFGINNYTLRYQVDTPLSSHVFFAGIGSTSSRELMRIVGNGNVGIGTSSPNAPLQFANDIRNRKIVLWDGSNNDHQYYGLGINNYTLRYQVDTPLSSHVFFAATGSASSQELMRIAGNGNVGIGTSNINTAYKLSVNGSVRAKEVVVESGWADFVFDKTYRLRPLGEVERYIQTHGHLPDMPSAEEVQQNGVKVGETAAQLLQKIEELTLYVIQQQKEIEALKSKLTHPDPQR